MSVALPVIRQFQITPLPAAVLLLPNQVYIFFYGNKLFQSNFIAVLTPNNKSVMLGWLYNLINVGVSLVGYYLASFLIDNKLCKWSHAKRVFAKY